MPERTFLKPCNQTKEAVMGIDDLELGPGSEKNERQTILGITKKRKFGCLTFLYFETYAHIAAFCSIAKNVLKENVINYCQISFYNPNLTFMTDEYERFIQPLIDLQSIPADSSEEKGLETRIRKLTEEIVILEANLREKKEELAEIEKYQAGMQIS